jgi:hypothetical protein
LRELVPPTLEAPLHHYYAFIILVFVTDVQSIDKKNVEKYVVVERGNADG